MNGTNPEYSVDISSVGSWAGFSLNDLFIDPTGMFLIYVDTSEAVNRRNFGTAWSLNTLGSVQSSRDFSSQGVGADPSEIDFDGTGDTFFIVDRHNGDIDIFDCPTPYDYMNATKNPNLYLLEQTQINGTCFDYLGNNFYIISNNTKKAYQYFLDSPYALMTANTSIFPITKSETRDSVEYSYTIDKDGSTYSFTSSVGGVENTYTPLQMLTSGTTGATEDKAYIGDNGTWLAKPAIWRSDGIYLRTNIDAPIEYNTPAETASVIITTIKDIDGFVYIEPENKYKPFDNKHYTVATTEGTSSEEVTYVIKSLADFDTLAIGNLLAKTVTADFRQEDGTLVNTVTWEVDGTRDEAEVLPRTATTVVLYSDTVVPANGYVNISILLCPCTTHMEVGTILFGLSAEVGFTNLNLSNKYTDFSLAEHDTFGNLDYVEKEKVAVYSGSVDVKIKNYDRIDRLMISLGKNLIIMNGSSAKNIEPNGKSIFASTMRIGRIMNFEQRTKINQNDIDEKATYSFILEELV